ncbi:unnamed protein product [Ambrosiozyma monospora]|uniref:Unnamed protein product n=1 Tax=Ambrosiozyma monospora TaxID=43982 RepID=A0ACB5T3M5_AMBMO|nr:unnamed protein product [Ambrosiozyma monospora]
MVENSDNSDSQSPSFPHHTDQSQGQVQGHSHGQGQTTAKHGKTHVKFKRNRSVRACQTCSKRKVRCDVMKKDYPNEKCTNCKEFGIECILVEKRKKRTKAQIEADKLVELEKLRETTGMNDEEYEKQKELIKAARLTKQHRKRKKKDKSNEDEENEKAAETGNNNNDQNTATITVKQETNGSPSYQSQQPIPRISRLEDRSIKIDQRAILDREINARQMSEFIKVISTMTDIRYPMTEYYSRNGKMMTIGEFLSKETLISLQCSQCFTIPEESKSWEYINAYFERFHILFPCRV